MKNLRDTIHRSIQEIQLAGDQAAELGGALDEATANMKSLDISEFADLIAADNRFTGRHEYKIESARFNAEQRRLILPTGYIGVLDLDYKNDIGFSLYSVTDTVDLDSPVQKTVDNTENPFPIPSMALAKGFRQLAYNLRASDTRHLSPVAWSAEKRGTPLTLGWRQHGSGILVAGSGFMPGATLQHVLETDTVLAEHMALESEETKAFRGSGLCDDIAIGACMGLWARAQTHAHQLIAEGASLN